MPRSLGLRPQSLLLETRWVNDWFSRVLEAKAALGGDESARSLLVTDRSPLSAILYTENNNGRLLEPLVRRMIAELREQAGIELYVVHIRVRRDVLWRRVQQRLLLEPYRAELKEDSEEWLEEVLAFYNTLEVDFECDNTREGSEAVEAVRAELLHRLKCRSPRFRRLSAAGEAAAGKSPPSPIAFYYPRAAAEDRLRNELDAAHWAAADVQ